MPHAATKMSHSQSSQAQQPEQQNHPPQHSTTYHMDDTSMMRSSATYPYPYSRTSRRHSNGNTHTHAVDVDSSAPSTRRNTPQSQHATAVVIPNHPNVAFLSKYQFTLPAVISDLALGNYDKAEDGQSATTRGIHTLPASFQPTNLDVVCGRGKGSYNRPGNRRFRAIVQQHTEEYKAARSKLDKTMVLNRIMDRVQAQNSGNTMFLKVGKDGLFTVISDDNAREKVGHAIRESILAAEQSNHSGNHHLKQHQPEWNQKHSDLLAQQKSIFQNLVG
jgi:hypothetical protein